MQSHVNTASPSQCEGPPGLLVVLRMILLCAWCGWMAWKFVWFVHPVAYQDWDVGWFVLGLLWFSGPLVATMVSAGGAWPWGSVPCPLLFRDSEKVYSLAFGLLGETAPSAGART
jgi:hypothetical protein